MQALTSQDVLVLAPAFTGWKQTDTPPKPEGPSVSGWDALNGKPNCLDPAYPQQNGFPFPPEVILGGFLFVDGR